MREARGFTQTKRTTKGPKMNYETFNASVIARIKNIIAEHGDSWKNCWVPVHPEVIGDHMNLCTYETSKCGDIREGVTVGTVWGILKIGGVCRDMGLHGNPNTDSIVAKWKNFCDVSGFGSIPHICNDGTKNGEVMLSWREVNIGALNRLKAMQNG